VQPRRVDGGRRRRRPLADGAGAAPATRLAMVLGANIGISMVLWCGQFALLERTLDAPRRAEA
jgi:hypothetical protein